MLDKSPDALAPKRARTRTPARAALTPAVLHAALIRAASSAPSNAKRGKRSAAARAAAEWRERLDESAEQARLEWLDRPRLHIGRFVRVARDEDIIAQGGAILSRDDPTQEVEEIAKKMGWSNWRLDIFTQLVAAYGHNPTIKNYLRVRHEFPEVEIQVGFSGIESLYALESDFKKQGIDPDLIAAAFDSDEPCVDALSLHLLELLVAREKLPTDGPRHIQMRRDAISDTTVSYLIATMLEAFDWNDEEFRIPASLVVLIRHQLCGQRPDLHTKYLSNKQRTNMAIRVAQILKPGEKLSINKLAQMTGLKRPTAARWLKQGFSTQVARFQRLL